jgi:hypothetical protein
MKRVAFAVAAVVALLLPAAGEAQVQIPTVSASFEYTPANPVAGQEITLRATSTSNPSGAIDHSWDLDGDGKFTDGEGASVKTSFAQPGTHTVRMRARLAGTAAVVDVAERAIVVGGTTPPPEPTPEPGNQPPVATYDKQCHKLGTLVSCAGLRARESVPKVLDASPSHDPDGSIVKYEWDLDANGEFERDTGSTPTVTHTFEALNGLIYTRKRLVRVRVTDDQGATDTDEATLTLLEPACRPGMTHGKLNVKSDCIRKRNIERDGREVTRWYSKEAVVINGITVRPLSGSTIVIDLPEGAAPEIKANRAAVLVPAKGSTAKLFDGRIAWRLSFDRLAGFEVDGQARLNGLRVTGMPSPPELMSGGSSKLGLFLALPQQFGGATSDQPITLRPGAATTAASSPLSFEVRDAAVGPIGLHHLKVTYDGVDLWEISAKVGLPDPIPYTIEGDAGVRGGEFEHAGAAVDFGSPGVGPFGPVFLQRIAFRIEIKPKKSKCVPHIGVETFDQQKFMQDTFGWTFDPPLPDVKIDYGIPTFALCGDVKLTAGPNILGASAISLDAGLGLATYADRPAVLRAYGRLRLVEIPLADARLQFHTDGYMKLRADFRWGLDGIASLEGFLLFEAMFPKFNAEAYIQACLEFVDWCASAKALVSSKGVAVCLKIDVLVDDWEPGFGYRWGETFPTLYFAGCELGPYREHIKRANASGARAAAAGDARTIELPAGLPGAVVALEGKDAPPKVTLVGPQGERITTPDDLKPVQQSPFFVLKDPRAKLTQIAISKPSAGRWRIEVEDGSSEIVSLRSANGLDEPKIDARVTGRGHRRTLSYRIEPREGQKVTFMESGPSAGTLIGVAKGSEGRLRFDPADGRAERRDIVAVVEQDGQMRDRIKVASYRAPSAQRPGKPSQLRLRRVRSTLVATWRGARGAERHQAAVRLSNGRRTVITTRRHRVAIRHVPRHVSGTVRVHGLTPAGMKGRAAVAELRRRAAR